MMVRPGSETVVVVGGGIVGIACAHYLSDAGMDVTVIDRQRIGGACSHANCGFICPSHVLPLTEPGAFGVALKSFFNPRAPFRVKPRLSPSLMCWMLQFARRCRHSRMLEAGKPLKAILDSSMTEYRRLIADQQIDGQWKNNGLLYVFRSERELEKFQQTDELVRKHFGVAASNISGTDLPEFDPALKSDLAGACYYEDDCSVRPDQLISHWVAMLRHRGVRFVEDCALQSIDRVNSRIRGIDTTTGEMFADHFVIATGAWSSRLATSLGCRIPTEPGKGYSVTMNRPDPCPRYPMLFPEHKVGVTPFEDGYRLGSIMEFSGFDTSISPHRIEQLKQSAVPYLKAPFTTEVTETWYGWRPMTWDSLPIIGQVPRLHNAYLATGHNMLGLSLATATGRLIAELISGNPPHLDMTPYSPTRFN